MTDLVIDACRWHVEAESLLHKQHALDHFCDKYLVLLDFLRANDLLQEPRLGQAVDNWLSFEIRQSHLTDDGYALFKLCHSKWSPAYGQAHAQRHLIPWKRGLASLRSGA